MIDCQSMRHRRADDAKVSVYRASTLRQTYLLCTTETSFTSCRHSKQYSVGVELRALLLRFVYRETICRILLLLCEVLAVS